MATMEELLNLTPDGWKTFAKMNEAERAEYLKDIVNLEPPVKVRNIADEVEDKEDETEEADLPLSNGSQTELDKLRDAAADDNSPFAKSRKRKQAAKASKQAKKKQSDNVTDAEFELLKKELGMED